ncbi:MAG: PAS domain-containing protein [Bacteroidales bacterium]|nr:PAS domain-containing protein [Bacteroidales bacterium]
MKNLENKTKEQLLIELGKLNAKIVELEKSKIEKKRIEEECAKTRERLELAMNAGEHGFWDWNLDTNDIYFSPGYYTMLGYEPGELPMRLETWVDLMHPDDKKTIVPEVENYVKNAQTYEVEFRLKTKDGNWRWISGKGKSFEKDKDGVSHRAVGVHVDITERNQAEEELKRHRDHLEDLVKERTREVEEKNRKLSEQMKVFVGRELTIRDLQNRIKALGGK